MPSHWIPRKEIRAENEVEMLAMAWKLGTRTILARLDCLHQGIAGWWGSVRRALGDLRLIRSSRLSIRGPHTSYLTLAERG